MFEEGRMHKGVGLVVLAHTGRSAHARNHLHGRQISLHSGGGGGGGGGEKLCVILSRVLCFAASIEICCDPDRQRLILGHC